MSRSGALALLVVVAGCDPNTYVDRAAKDCQDTCQSILDQEGPKIVQQAWDQCSSYYEQTVLPQLKTDLAAAEDEVIARLKAELVAWEKDAETQLFTRIGCSPAATLAGWDCTATGLCPIR